MLTWPPERERGGERGSTPSLPMVLHHGLVGRGWGGNGGGAYEWNPSPWFRKERDDMNGESAVCQLRSHNT